MNFQFPSRKSIITIGAASLLALSFSMTLAPTTSFAAVTLDSEVESGLPVPKQRSEKSVEKTPYLTTVRATVPAGLEDLSGFYHAELEKLNWQEDKSKASMSPDSAEFRFKSPQGPAMLTLTKKGDDTEVMLFVRDAEAAKASGLMAPEGKTKVILGNFLDGDATVTIDNKAIKVAAHAGETGSDGPKLELKPGSYTYKVEAPGKEPMTAEIGIGSNEIWGLMIGPGGMLPMQLY